MHVHINTLLQTQMHACNAVHACILVTHKETMGGE